jgi:hypothetical protein
MVGSGLGAATSYLTGGGQPKTETSFKGGVADQFTKAPGTDRSDKYQGGNQDLFADKAKTIKDYQPRLGASVSADNVQQANRAGDEDNHLDVLQLKRAAKAEGKFGADGLQAAAEFGASGSMLAGHAKGDKALGQFGKASGEVDASFMTATAEAKGNLKAGWDGVSAEGEAGIGAYLGKGSAKGEMGFRVPFTNIELYGGAEGQAALGVGASAKGSLDYGAEGFRAGGRVGGSIGLGGALGFFGGVRKADPTAGWMGAAAPTAAPAPTTAPAPRRNP